MKRLLHSLFWVGLGVLMAVVIGWSTTFAYPEYTARTGEQCTACHVNPAGGGPRTLRGLLWLAEGKPDRVPLLPGSATADAEAPDGSGLYEALGCGGCHGLVGEGGVGPALNQAEWESGALIDVIVNGIGTMQGYGIDALSTAEMEALTAYLQAMGRGEIESTIVLTQRPLAPARFACDGNPDAGAMNTATPTACDGN